VAVDLNWELTILEIVQGFYLNLLRDFLQDEVTPPRGLEDDSLRASNRDVAQLLPSMRRWLKLLDMAITPEMLRRSLTTTVDHDLAEALLRYYARKQSKNDFDRDKTEPRYFKHLGLYAYRKPALDLFVSQPESTLEKSERLEQLRFLENGIAIYVGETPYDSVGVDTEEDLQRAAQILTRRDARGTKH